MVRASEELIEAIAALRRTAGAEFSGNIFYLIESQIAALFESLSAGESLAAPAAITNKGGFARALSEVRRLALRELSGNRFYRAWLEIDNLAYLAAAQAGKPAGRNDLKHGRPPTFDELAAASRLRVSEVAASLGIKALQPPALQSSESYELERRSSEPCAMAELAPLRSVQTESGGSDHAAGAIPAGVAVQGKVATAVKPAAKAVEAKPRKSFLSRLLGSLFGRRH